MRGGVAARLFSVLLSILVLQAGTATAQSSPIEGIWRTPHLTEITIVPCPEGFCGRISKVVVPEHVLSGLDRAEIENMRVEDYFDANNKDPRLRTRPILGLQILVVRPGNRGHVFDGEIYNPEDGNTYSGYLEVLGPDIVRLNGCVLFNVLCRGENWQRISSR